MSSRERILIIAFSTISSDARVLKQVRRFALEYDVVTLGYGPAPDGVTRHLRVPDDLQIWRWPRLLIVLRQYRRAYRGNPAIAAALKLLSGTAVDFVLANDVEAAGVALSVAAPDRIHVDLHEYAPRQREELWRWRTFIAPFVHWMMRAHVKRAASFTTVSVGIAREFQRRYSINPQLVINATPFVAADPTSTPSVIRLVHSGAGLANRGLELTIAAVEKTRSKVSLDLFLTPNDPAFMEKLRRLCADSARVKLHDPVPYSVLIARLRAYDVGVFVLPPVNFNYRWALPNKLFDFVQARLAVIIGPSPEMSQIVEDWGFGMVTSSFTEEALIETLDGLTASLVDQCKAGTVAAADALSSERQSEAWAKAVAALRPPAIN